MRIFVQACIEGEGERPSRIITVGVIERGDEFAPCSGLGLFMSETKALLKQLQTVFVDEQVDRFFDVSAHCLSCQTPRGIKDTKRLVYRTVFGKASLRSSRYYSVCSTCGFCSGDKSTVSPLSHALAERVHPQWTWLQCRYPSVMSYRLAQIYLRDAFAGGTELPSSSVKANVRAVGERLEKEAQRAKWAAAKATAPRNRPALTGLPVSLQIDAGGILATRPLEGNRWIPVVVSKIFRPATPQPRIPMRMPMRADPTPDKAYASRPFCSRLELVWRCRSQCCVMAVTTSALPASCRGQRRGFWTGFTSA